MADYISVNEAAARWFVSERSVTGFCRAGKIDGATKNGSSWSIPADAEKPEDHRVKSGIYRGARKKGQEAEIRPGDRLPLPVGVSDYALASSEYYYVDKTLMIRDFLDERAKVSLFTRPRRFGKTLNMDMLRTFFEKTDADTSHFFTDKKIWDCGEKYRAEQGKYPVIFLSFKDVKFNTWEETVEEIRNIFSREFKRHSEVLADFQIHETERAFFESIVAKTASFVDLTHALEYLSEYLHRYYGEAAVVIIDEYDTPIQQGHTKGFYDEVIGFMRVLLSGCFKDNRHLAYGFLTGILRVAKESIFSGLNNIVIHSVLDGKYSEYFGFTTAEICEMADYYGRRDKLPELAAWYDGYRFGNTEIYNPWSVVNYFSNQCEPRAYWLSSGSNDIIGEMIQAADDEISYRLLSLVNGGTFVTYIDTGVVYPEVRKNPATLYSFLLVAGYLKVVRAVVSVSGDFIAEVALPNREISLVYRKEILAKLETMIPQSAAIAVEEAVFSGDADRLQDTLHALLLRSASCFDTAKENFYHGFMLGICALLGGTYVTSNRESGEGRYDIELSPVKRKLPGILIELKACKDGDAEQLNALAEAALRQIEEKKYDTELKAKGVSKIIKYGVAFSGRNVSIAVSSDS